MHPDLLDTLRDAQRVGFFGPGSMERAVEHAHGFVDALGPLPVGARLIDLGSGGGLPGLVLADAYPDVELWLVDRRRKRTDFLERAVRRLAFGHTTVVAADVADIVRSVRTGELRPFDAVTARGFGPPDVTLSSGVAVCAVGGRVVISEPPSGDRWDPSLLETSGLTSERVGPVRVFLRA